jgi:hypothetical protein
MKAQQQKSGPSKDELAKPAPVTALATTAPEYLDVFASEKPEGFEEVTPNDVKVPRLAVAQALTPQLEETNPNHIPSLKKGDFFNTVTGDVFGPSVKIIPLLKFGNRIRFGDMDKGGGILCRSDDMIHGVGDNPVDGVCAKCPYAQFGSAREGKGKGTACSEFMNFPDLVVTNGKIDTSNTMIWSAKSSHIDAAKQLIGLAMRRKLASGQRAPMWSGVYTLTSKLKKFTEKLQAYVVSVDNAGWVPASDAPLVKSAYDFMHDLREQRRLTTDDETLRDEPDNGAA